MTAIIKNNFRLQNARDFLENFTSHPLSIPLTQKIQITSQGAAGASPEKGSARLTWDFDRTTNSSLDAPADAKLALKTAVTGAHIEDRNHYLFVGKPTPWSKTNSNLELFPVAPSDTLEEESRVWDEMLSLKKITEVFGSLVIPRSDWDASGNTIYAKYDDRDPSLHQQPTRSAADFAASRGGKYAGNFYVLTDNFDLFVCLENGRGAASTEKPIRPNGDPTDLVDYSEVDGYVWKYITRIKQSDIVKFLTDSWIPVKTLTQDDGSGSNQFAVQQGAIAGTALSFVVDSVGQGYTKTHKGQLNSVTSISQAGVNKGKAKLTTIQNGPALLNDNDAYKNCQLHVVSGDGVGGVYTIESYLGSGNEIVLTGPWDANNMVSDNSVYEILPALSIVSNGTTKIKAKPIVKNGEIVRIKITQGGSGATWAAATVLDSAGGTGAAIRPVLSGTKGLGKDPEKDLGAFFVMLNAKLQYNEGEGDFPYNNDYRQIGIIRNVRESDGKLATKNTLAATKRFKVSSITTADKGAFRADEQFTATVNGNVISAQILDFIPDADAVNHANEGVISFIQTPETGYGTFVTGTLLTGTITGCTALITEILDEEVQKFEGEILYLENRRPVLRSSDQVEDIKTIIEF